MLEYPNIIYRFYRLIYTKEVSDYSDYNINIRCRRVQLESIAIEFNFLSYVFLLQYFDTLRGLDLFHYY